MSVHDNDYISSGLTRAIGLTHQEEISYKQGMTEHRAMAVAEIETSTGSMFPVKRGSLNLSKLLTGVSALECASKSMLRDVDFVANVIRIMGLSFDPRATYGDENVYMNSSRFGLWQHPVQLAKAAVELSLTPPTSIVEIGTFKGFTSTFLAAYFRMFQSDLEFVTLDPVVHIEPYRVWEALGIHFVRGTSSDISGACFDLCFIDGDHSFEGIARDYYHLGQHANMCMFHDIQETLCPDVQRFWSHLQREYSHRYTFTEFLDHSEGEPMMGIGVCKRI